MSGWEIVAILAGAALAVYAAFVVVLLLLGRRQEARALAGFVPDCIVLFSRLVRDPCVSRGRRILLVGLLGYLALPIDLVPDFIPVAGRLDDAIIAALVLRYALRGCGEEIERHWPGPRASLDPLLRLAGGSREGGEREYPEAPMTLSGPSRTIRVEPLDARRAGYERSASARARPERDEPHEPAAAPREERPTEEARPRLEPVSDAR